MKRNSIATSSLVVLSLLLTATGAYAQSGERAKVPFAFTVGTAHVPAGTYTVTRKFGTNVVMISNVRTGAAVLALGNVESPSKITQKLIFHRDGSHYTLTEIWGAAGSNGMAILAPRAKHPLELASAPVNPANTFQIALK
jgi:hypothetical protein